MRKKEGVGCWKALDILRNSLDHVLQVTVSYWRTFKLENEIIKYAFWERSLWWLPLSRENKLKDVTLETGKFEVIWHLKTNDQVITWCQEAYNLIVSSYEQPKCMSHLSRMIFFKYIWREETGRVPVTYQLHRWVSPHSHLRASQMKHDICPKWYCWLHTAWNHLSLTT